jgi:type IV secretory pathway VirJ component
MRDAELIATKGGHHFDGDYVALAGIILDGARRRAGAAASPSLTSSSPR